MSFILVGTNHKYSPIEFRERIFFSKKRLKDALDFLMAGKALKGAVILSTCNRIEIYAYADDPKEGIKELNDFISRYHEIESKRFYPYLYTYRDKEAMKHLFSVTCGLDSLILGETQILGQVKSSFLESENAGFLDGFSKKVFYSAISFAKRIHKETAISEGRVSVGSTAVDFIKKRLGTISGKNILIVGMGKVTELVLKYLLPRAGKKENPNVVFVANRTFEKAKELADRIEAKAVRFDCLMHFLKEADIMITATASPHFIIKKESLEKVFGFRPSAAGRKLIIIDLALPRDVEPSVGEIENVDLFYLEDLDAAIKSNMERKNEEAKRATKIIDIEAEKLWSGIIKSEQEPALLP